MIEPLKTCGNCAHYRPNVNPETGRKRPAWAGECAWPRPPVTIYPVWLTVMQSGSNRVHKNDFAGNCRCWTAVPARPAIKDEASTFVEVVECVAWAVQVIPNLGEEWWWVDVDLKKHTGFGRHSPKFKVVRHPKCDVQITGWMAFTARERA